jgi:hypothetical protein
MGRPHTPVSIEVASRSIFRANYVATRPVRIKLTTYPSRVTPVLFHLSLTSCLYCNFVDYIL